MASSIKLVYFNLRGRGELIRYILTVSGVEFENKLVTFEEWPTVKPTTPYGQLPYMEIDGQTFTESVALARYLARKYDLYGKDEIEGLNADIILSLVEELKDRYVRYRFDSLLNEEQKKTLCDKLHSEQIPALFDRLEKKLEENQSGYLVGDNMTIADLAVTDICDQVDVEIPGFFDSGKYPKVKDLRKKVKDNDKLSAYLASRKDSEI